MKTDRRTEEENLGRRKKKVRYEMTDRHTHMDVDEGEEGEIEEGYGIVLDANVHCHEMDDIYRSDDDDDEMQKDADTAHTTAIAAAPQQQIPTSSSHQDAEPPNQTPSEWSNYRYKYKNTTRTTIQRQHMSAIQLQTEFSYPGDSECKIEVALDDARDIVITVSTTVGKSAADFMAQYFEKMCSSNGFCLKILENP